MKKVFYSLAFVAIVSILSSCSPKPEEMILGTWTLSNIEIGNADEVAQTFLDMQVGILDQQILQLEEMTATIEEELEKETYLAQLNELKAQKAGFTLETIKEEFSKEFDNMIGSYKLVFNEDKSYKSLLDDKEGTWALNEDASVLTITEGERDVTFNIKEFTESKLDVSFEESQGEMAVKMNMTFTKGETSEEVTEEVTEEEAH